MRLVIGRSCPLHDRASEAPFSSQQPRVGREIEAMFSLRTLPARAGRPSICAQCLRLNRISARPLSLLSTHASRPSADQRFPARTHPSSILTPSRNFATKSTADELIENIQDQYATARDEFEIATEETEKKSVYAADDRAAAREELDKLKEMFEEALAGSEGEEVQRRVGQRIRELDNAVAGLEKAASEE